MKRLALAVLFMLAMSAPVLGQGVTHGNGDPTVISPTPNCALNRLYVDDSTQKLYLASQGSPCVWVLSGASGTTINPTNGVPPVRSNSTTFRDGVAADFIALFTSCSGAQYLGADGQCHNASGGFAAPAGWSIANGNWNGGLNNALDVSATLTALPFSGSRVTASLFTGTLTGTPAVGNDFKTIQYNTNITGTANSGDTWADTYRVCNFNLNNAAGVLTHPLCQVFRQVYTSTAGSTTQLAASIYGTMGLTNSNGAIGTLSVAHFEYDAALSGTGTDSDMNVVGIIIPGAITGSPSVPALEGLEVGDISAAGTPGTAQAGISIGGAVSGVKTPFYVTAGTVANINYMMEVNGAKPIWFPSSTLLLGPSNVLNANFTAAATPIQASCSGGACGYGIYNGTMDFFIGENASNDLTIQRPDNGTTFATFANATGIVTVPKFGITNLLFSSTAPTISSGFGTSPSVTTNNGTAAFTINVGTGGTATNGVIGLPTATNGWVCTGQDLTTQSTTVFLLKQIATSTTTATMANFNTAGAQAAWVASDILHISCDAR